MSPDPQPVDFSNLDALLDEPPLAEPTAEPANPLQALDDLLAGTIRSREQERQHAADLKARKRNFAGMSKDEIEYCNSRMQAFEAARVWNTELNLAVFTRFQCACGETRTVFARWMVQQRGIQNPNNRRWLVMDHRVKHLRVQPTFEVRAVDLCTVCAVIAGMDTHGMRELQEVFK